ncbi:hypothetical protein VDGL01_11769 [Verticillium dahliae]
MTAPGPLYPTPSACTSINPVPASNGNDREGDPGSTTDGKEDTDSNHEDMVCGHEAFLDTMEAENHDLSQLPRALTMPLTMEDLGRSFRNPHELLQVAMPDKPANIAAESPSLKKQTDDEPGANSRPNVGPHDPDGRTLSVQLHDLAGGFRKLADTLDCLSRIEGLHSLNPTGGPTIRQHTKRKKPTKAAHPQKKRRGPKPESVSSQVAHL